MEEDLLEEVAVVGKPAAELYSRLEWIMCRDLVDKGEEEAEGEEVGGGGVELGVDGVPLEKSRDRAGRSCVVHSVSNPGKSGILRSELVPSPVVKAQRGPKTEELVTQYFSSLLAIARPALITRPSPERTPAKSAMFTLVWCALIGETDDARALFKLGIYDCCLCIRSTSSLQLARR